MSDYCSWCKEGPVVTLANGRRACAKEECQRFLEAWLQETCVISKENGWDFRPMKITKPIPPDGPMKRAREYKPFERDDYRPSSITRIGLSTIVVIGLVAIAWVLIVGHAPVLAWLVGFAMAIGFGLLMREIWKI